MTLPASLCNLDCSDNLGVGGNFSLPHVLPPRLESLQLQRSYVHGLPQQLPHSLRTLDVGFTPSLEQLHPEQSCQQVCTTDLCCGDNTEEWIWHLWRGS